MKISLTKHQKYALSVIVVIFLVAIALDWMGVSGLMEKTTLVEQINEKKGKSELADLLGRTGGLGEVKKEIDQTDELARVLAKKDDDLMGSWREATKEAMGTGKDWAQDVNKWKDQLVKCNDEILKKSFRMEKTKSVGLAPNFYLGLENFKQRSPREDQLPELSLQLSVSKRLVDLLIQAKETATEGYPTSCTLLKLQGPLSDLIEASSESVAKEKGGEKKPTSRNHYLMEFESSPEVLYTFINDISRDRFFFVPCNLVVANMREGFPKRSELAAQFVSARAEGSSTSEGVLRSKDAKNKTPLLKILAGDEKVLVKVQIDFVQFGNVGEEKSPAQVRKL